ncbi:MAG: phosphoribosylglycinamide formyltransferase [Planctomycetota bacterium]|nr:MAG: phosphoribosylglycinamide formyltransferase [Planctomycetota bacterium]REK26169.1 MAG: phosphoribosylglycinamide formyltransferase [Planctomycetota bacterium]REK33538.1 MAG: phosphoribosylglycinamide formyltransferase [Planctomycetota bacterium]
MSTALDRPIRLGVLISGGGTTLLNLHDRIQSGALSAEIPLVISSRQTAGVEKAKSVGLPCEVLPRQEFDSTSAFSEALFAQLRRAEIDLVILAGFLCRIDIPADFEQRVMNIHPALIPAFCGKGMHGRHVHEAVLQRGCKVSGCTVHFCDNEYDHGPIILQRAVPVLDDDTPEALAARVFEHECLAYPEAIRLYSEGRLTIIGSRVLIDRNGTG